MIDEESGSSTFSWRSDNSPQLEEHAMTDASMIFYLPIVTLMLFMALGAADLSRTNAAIRAENDPRSRR